MLDKLKKSRYIRAILTVSCVGVCVFFLTLADAVGRIRFVPGSGSGKPDPLVNVDSEADEGLATAKKFLDEGNLKVGMEYVRTLIENKGDVMFKQPDGRTYVSMRKKINELIGNSGKDVLKRYRMLYDAKAGAMFDEAMSSDDPAGGTKKLQEISERYPHSSYGAKAFEALAEIHLDAGRFSLACQCLREAMELLGKDGQNQNQNQKPILLSKLAVARHLNGQPAKVEKILQHLKEKYPDVRARMGREDMNLVEFVEEVMKLSPMILSRRIYSDSWPGLGGVSDGQANMGDIDVVLKSGWNSIPSGVNKNSLEKGLLGGAFPGITSGRGNLGKRVVKLMDGHVCASYLVRGQSSRKTIQAPRILPVSDGKLIFYRDDEKIYARDFFTGELEWHSYPLPVVLKGKEKATNRRVDTGRYGLTLGGGNVFALSEIVKETKHHQYRGIMWGGRGGRQAGPAPLAPRSVLSAFSIDGGKSKWSTDQLTVTEFLRKSKFLSLPTYSEGRLYVVVWYENRYQLVCLDANTGNLVWNVSMGRRPERFGSIEGVNVGTPPAISDGVIIATTNAGLVFAAIAQTGQPLWAYQYDSNLSQSGSNYSPTSGVESYKTMNPIIISGSKAILLPADSNELIALDVRNGGSVWKVKSNIYGQKDLSAIDEKRILLSGTALIVIDSDNGKKLNENIMAPGCEFILGRPVVTPTSVIASGQGAVFRMDLVEPGYKITKLGDIDYGDILGNLISVNGNLIAANSAGICAYFNYPSARKYITKKISQTSQETEDDVKAKMDLLFQRARLARKSLNFAESLADYAQIELLDKEDIQAGTIQSRKHQLYIDMANHTEESSKVIGALVKAMELAQTNQQKAHTLIRLAKARESNGEYVAAIELVKRLGQEYPAENLVNVGLGPDAKTPNSREREDWRDGRTIAEMLTRDLYDAHRIEISKHFDAGAKPLYERAKKKDDLKLFMEVVNDWPLSGYADRAKFSAAAILNQNAQEITDPADKRKMLVRVRCLLASVASKTESPLHQPALAAIVDMFIERGAIDAAKIYAMELKDLDPNTEFTFGKKNLKLSEILAKLENEKGSGIALQETLSSNVSPDVRECFRINDPDAYILRDTNGKPITLGTGVFLFRGNNITFCDLFADNAADSERFYGKAMFADEHGQGQRRASYENLRAGLCRSEKGNFLVLADNLGVIALDLVSGKIKWRKTMQQLSISQNSQKIISGNFLLILGKEGQIYCVGLETGRLKWESAKPASGKPYGTFLASDDLVIAFGLVKRSYVTYVFDLKTGKILNKWAARVQSVSASASDNNCWVINGTKFDLFSRADLLKDGKTSKPLSVYKCQSSTGATCPVSNDDWSIFNFPIMGRNGRSPMVALPMKKGAGKPAGLLSPTYQSRLLVPLAGAIRDDSVYFTFGIKSSSGRQVYYVRSGVMVKKPMSSLSAKASRGQNKIVKYDLKTGKTLWECEISTDEHLVHTKPIVGSSTLFFYAVSASGEGPDTCYIVATDTGKLLRKIKIPSRSRKGVAGAGANRKKYFGIPAILDGRVCVETVDGVIIYGE